MAEVAKTYDAVGEVRKVRDSLAKELNRLEGPEERVAFLKGRLEQARKKRAEHPQHNEHKS